MCRGHSGVMNPRVSLIHLQQFLCVDILFICMLFPYPSPSTILMQIPAFFNFIREYLCVNI